MANLIAEFGGRQNGKTARARELVAEAEASGQWVVVVSRDGAHCSRCERDASECRGSCMEVES